MAHSGTNTGEQKDGRDPGRGRHSSDGGRMRHRRQSSGGGSSIMSKLNSLLRRTSLPHIGSDSSKHEHRQHNHHHHSHHSRKDSGSGSGIDEKGNNEALVSGNIEKQNGKSAKSTQSTQSTQITQNSRPSKRSEARTDGTIGHDATEPSSHSNESMRKAAAAAEEADLASADSYGEKEGGSQEQQTEAWRDTDAADDKGDETERPTMLGPTATFTETYTSNPAPGMWGSGESGSSSEDEDEDDGEEKEEKEAAAARPNMPLEPDEYEEEYNVPWLVEQMGMGEQPFSSLLDDHVGYINPRAYTDSIASVGSSGIGNGYEADENDGDRKHERKRQRRLAFEIIKRQLAEARVGIPKNPQRPSKSDYKRKDETVDYIGYGCGLVKHYADTQLRYKIDYRHSSDDPCKLDRFLLTLQRLVEVSAPYQRLAVWLYRLARWDNPRQTAWWCAGYFVLLYLGMLSMFAWMVPAFVIAYHRLRPSQAYQWLGFERPETSIIPRKFVQDASSSTLGKGLVANRLWEIWRETLGAQVHLILADVADWMERAKNCATWKRPWASRSIMVVLSCMGLTTYLVPSHVFQRLLGVCVGVQFFFLAPLQLRHERYRRMLWVVDWILWHAPTDVEMALDTLYTHSACHREAAGLCAVCHDAARPDSLAAEARRFVGTIAADLVSAYHPLAKTRHHPITILQTASSTCLDRLDDETSAGTSGKLEVLGKRLAKSVADAGVGVGADETEYGGLGAGDSVRLPTMMKDFEEREWLKTSGLVFPVARAFSVDTLGGFEDEKVAVSQTKAKTKANVLGQARTNDRQPPAITRTDASLQGGSGTSGSGSASSPTTERSLMSRAKDLSSKILRRRSSHGSAGSEAKTATDMLAPPEPDDLEAERRRRSMQSHSLRGVPPSADPRALPPTASEPQARRSDKRVSLDGLLTAESAESLASSDASGSLELMREANELSGLRNKDARPAAKGVDLNSLYAFRCLHQGKYGTLFVTPDRFIFRRSRIMGGHRSSVSTHLLSSVVAIRKSTSRFSKSHGIQLLLVDGSAYSYFGLARRDDVFGFLLVRCGHTHPYAV